MALTFKEIHLVNLKFYFRTGRRKSKVKKQNSFQMKTGKTKPHSTKNIQCIRSFDFSKIYIMDFLFASTAGFSAAD